MGKNDYHPQFETLFFSPFFLSLSFPPLSLDSLFPCSPSSLLHRHSPHLPPALSRILHRGYVLDRDCRCSPNNAKLAVTLHLLPQAWHCEGIDGEDNDHPHLPGKDDDPSPLPTLAILPFPATTTKNLSQSSEFLEKLWSGVGCTLGKTNHTEQGVEHVPDYKRERLGSLQNGAMTMKIFMVQQLLMSSFNES
ncbi:unnamed protein product [Linum tenue]|uniref:Uncharacterized protein n=1 Tax=Linum tenue TaxID=586396 RepID=A0AAV0HDZ1_9ROSI|nr:unnamed protein product [Linum tenue]